jgi:hypothetical protein
MGESSKSFQNFEHYDYTALSRLWQACIAFFSMNSSAALTGKGGKCYYEEKDGN